MKKLDINLKILIAIIALFGLSFSLMAQSEPRQPYNQNRNHAGKGMLNLTEEQKADVKEIHLAKQKEIQPLKDEIRINKAKINALIKRDDPDMNEIVGLVEANGKILTQIQVKEIESQVQIRALLKGEQKIIFDAHYERVKRKRAMAQHFPRRMTHERSRF